MAKRASRIPAAAWSLERLEEGDGDGGGRVWYGWALTIPATSEEQDGGVSGAWVMEMMKGPSSSRSLLDAR
jgi:hypothetical protein